MTADALKTLEEQIARRERRSFRVAVLWGVSIFVLVLGVSYSLYKNEQQDDRLQTFSACAERPNSLDCIKGHANSVALTTHAEACYILAQGGRRCGPRPLPEASVYRRELLLTTGPDADEINYDAIPSTGSDPDRPASSVPPSSEPVSPATSAGLMRSPGERTLRPRPRTEYRRCARCRNNARAQPRATSRPAGSCRPCRP